MGPQNCAVNVPTRRTSTTARTIKFLCSYGGRILPRPADGHLRYVGGLTRVLSVNRSISFSDLMKKFGELCGYSVTVRAQLPSEDLDVLVSIKSDEDLANVIDVYHQAAVTSARELKIRAILSPLVYVKKHVSPSPSYSSLTMVSSSVDSSSIHRTLSGDSSPTKSMYKSPLSGESSPAKPEFSNHYPFHQQQQRSYYYPVKPAVVQSGKVVRSPVCCSRIEAVRDCYRPCHLQANSRLAHLFPYPITAIKRSF